MSHLSEAAALLQSGALYPSRLGLRSPAGSLAFAGFKHGAFSLYVDDEPFFHFDLEGRWQRAFVGETHYLKSLAGNVDALDRSREGRQMILQRRSLSPPEVADLDASIRSAALDLAADLTSGRREPVEPPSPARPIAPIELSGMMDRISRWDNSAWLAQAERHRAVYGPLPFLPPDATTAVVLQATVGKADRLAFGGLPTTGLTVKSPAEFSAHVAEVASLLGRRVVQSRGIFLSGADVARQPLAEVESWFREATRVFPLATSPAPPRRGDWPIDTPRLEGIDLFLDRFEPPRFSRADWSRLRTLGLRRINLGVESGALEVRSVFGKSWSNTMLRETVSDLKAAEIGISLLLLTGAGGSEQSDIHLQATADLVRSLDLGPGDLVSLLDDPGDAAARQQSRFLVRLTPLRQERGVKIAPYNREKQMV